MRTGGVVGGVPCCQPHGLRQAIDVECVVAPQPAQARHGRQGLVAARRGRLLRLRIDVGEERLPGSTAVLARQCEMSSTTCQGWGTPGRPWPGLTSCNVHARHSEMASHSLHTILEKLVAHADKRLPGSLCSVVLNSMSFSCRTAPTPPGAASQKKRT